MGETTKPGNDIPMAPGEIERAWIGEPFEQGEPRFLCAEVFAVHQWHEPEAPAGKLELRLYPPLCHGPTANGERPLITGKGMGRFPPDLAGELIEQQHQGKSFLRPLVPAVQ
jgi:hypothetical protein